MCAFVYMHFFFFNSQNWPISHQKGLQKLPDILHLNKELDGLGKETKNSAKVDLEDRNSMIYILILENVTCGY